MVNIAPVYAGTVCALATTSLTIGAIVAPYLVGAIVVAGTRTEWQLVFGIMAGCMTVSGIFYLVFGSGMVLNACPFEGFDDPDCSYSGSAAVGQVGGLGRRRRGP